MSLTILYIAGWGRNGSTILGSVLGQLADVFWVGELANTWRHDGAGPDRLCGCGVPFRSCELWSAAIRRAFGGFDHRDVAELKRLMDAVTRTRNLPSIALRGLRHDARRLASHLERLYAATAAVAGASILVDTSKNPVYAELLAAGGSHDFYLVELARDPRGVAHSWMRTKQTLDSSSSAHLPRIGPARSAALWTAWHIGAGALRRRLGDRATLLRYEDFLDEPRTEVLALRDLIRAVGEPPFVTERSVTVVPGHSLLGNPVRFRSGELELCLDDEWRRRLSAPHRAIVTGLTLPLLRRYGYPVRP